jgi:protein SCO1/2
MTESRRIMSDRSSRISTIVAACLLLAVSAFSGLSWYRHQAAIGGEGTMDNFGGPFRLTGSNGATIDSRNLAGKPFAIFFGYTHCPDVCPTTLSQVSHVLADLGDQAKYLPVLFVTVDPERDTPAVLRDYVSNFDHRIIGLSGSSAQIAEVAAAYKVFYERITTSDGAYAMNHTALVFLMGRGGELKSAISYDEDYATYLKKFRELLDAG